MVRQGTMVAAIVVLALTLLAIPLSALGIGYRQDTTLATTTVELRDGKIQWQQYPPTLSGPTARNQYGWQISPTPAARPSASSLAPRGVPLIAVMAVAIIVLVVASVGPRVVSHRRRRSGACLACGYDRRASGAERCPECGSLPDEALSGASKPVGYVVRDAGVALFIVLLLSVLGAYGVVRADRRSQALQWANTLDFSWYLNECRPRLTGEVAFAVPGDGPDGIANVVRSAKPGTTIVLLPGEHTLSERGSRFAAAGVWLLGCGSDQTTLRINQDAAKELRIENLTIDCANDTFMDLRRGGTLHLRGCTVQNYNSGAGGSSSFDGAETVLLVEGCTFEGKSGRASETGSFGNAFDLRGDNFAFVRGTHFIDNYSAWRYASGVIDRCDVKTPAGRPFLPPGGVPLFLRGWTAPSVGGLTTITECLDDAEILARVPAGELPRPSFWKDPVIREAAEVLDLDGKGGTRFWRRLTIHPDPAVRKIAAAHANLPPLPTPTISVDAAIEQVSTSVPVSKDVVFALLLSDPNIVRPKLESICDGGGPERVKNNARMILQLMTAQPSLPELVRYESLPPP